VERLRILPAVEDTDTNRAALTDAAREGRDEGTPSLPPGVGTMVSALPLPRDAFAQSRRRGDLTEINGIVWRNSGSIPERCFYRPHYRILDRRSAWRRVLRRWLRTALSMALLAPVTLGIDQPAAKPRWIVWRHTAAGIIVCRLPPRIRPRNLESFELFTPPCSAAYDPERSVIL
jgi:hypothetical protein